MGSPESQLQEYCQRAEHCLQSGDFAGANDTGEKIVKLVDALPPKTQVTALLIAAQIFGNSYLEDGGRRDDEERMALEARPISLLEQALETLPAGNEAMGLRSACYAQLTGYRERFAEFKAAEATFHQWLAECVNLNYFGLEYAQALTSFGAFLHGQQRSAEALPHLDKAVVAATKSQMPGAASVYVLRGAVSKQVEPNHPAFNDWDQQTDGFRNEFFSSAAQYLETLEERELPDALPLLQDLLSLSNDFAAARALVLQTLIANVARRGKHFEFAMRVYHAMQANPAATVPAQQASVLFAMALVAKEYQEQSAVETLFQEAATLARSADRSAMLASVLRNQAEWYMETGRAAAADELLQAALEAARDSGEAEEVGPTLVALGKLRAHAKDENAVEFLQEGLDNLPFTDPSALNAMLHLVSLEGNLPCPCQPLEHTEATASKLVSTAVMRLADGVFAEYDPAGPTMRLTRDLPREEALAYSALAFGAKAIYQHLTVAGR